jgi:N-glycosylase/DNA lyase
MIPGTTTYIFPVTDYDLDATLNSGQAFRWQKHCETWTGVIGHNWVRLRSEPGAIVAETSEGVSDWSWLVNYLQLNVDLPALLRTFPEDEPMRAAVNACRGLRLLRQDPWECLASFILSSTKQIVQIRQIIGMLCERFGEPLQANQPSPIVYSFPSPARLAQVTEAELRACKMGFRAPYLLAAAKAIDNGALELAGLHSLPVDAARIELTRLSGVGRKIADCVLLFGYGAQTAFPIDVWIAKALRELYFPRRKPNLQRLQDFAATHFGPHSGYAQQYLFHYMRTKKVGEKELMPMARPRSRLQQRRKKQSAPRGIRVVVPVIR